MHLIILIDFNDVQVEVVNYSFLSFITKGNIQNGFKISIWFFQNFLLIFFFTWFLERIIIMRNISMQASVSSFDTNQYCINVILFRSVDNNCDADLMRIWYGCHCFINLQNYHCHAYTLNFACRLLKNLLSQFKYW